MCELQLQKKLCGVGSSFAAGLAWNWVKVTAAASSAAGWTMRAPGCLRLFLLSLLLPWDQRAPRGLVLDSQGRACWWRLARKAGNVTSGRKAAVISEWDSDCEGNYNRKNDRIEDLLLWNGHLKPGRLQFMKLLFHIFKIIVFAIEKCYKYDCIFF